MLKKSRVTMTMATVTADNSSSGDIIAAAAAPFPVPLPDTSRLAAAEEKNRVLQARIDELNSQIGQSASSHTQEYNDAVLDLPRNMLQMILEEYGLDPQSIMCFVSASNKSKQATGTITIDMKGATKAATTTIKTAAMKKGIERIRHCKVWEHVELFLSASRMFKFKNLELHLDGATRYKYLNLHMRAAHKALPALEKSIFEPLRPDHSIKEIGRREGWMKSLWRDLVSQRLDPVSHAITKLCGTESDGVGHKEIGALAITNYDSGVLNLGGLVRVPSLKELRLTNVKGVLSSFGEFARHTRVERIIMRNCKVQHLSDINMCAHLEQLILENVGALETLEPLLAIKSLRKLTVQGCSNLKGVVDDPPRFGSVSGLRDLMILDCQKMNSLVDLAKLTKGTLCTLDISACPRLLDISDIAALESLESLSISGGRRVHQFPWLKELTSLKKLTINFPKFIDPEGWQDALVDIGKCQGLVKLHLQSWKNMEYIDDLCECLVTVEDLSLFGCVKLTCIKPLASAEKLKRLCLSFCERLPSIESLKMVNACTLQHLDISHCRLINRHGFRQCSHIQTLRYLMNPGSSLRTLHVSHWHEAESMVLIAVSEDAGVNLTWSGM